MINKLLINLLKMNLELFIVILIHQPNNPIVISIFIIIPYYHQTLSHSDSFWQTKHPLKKDNAEQILVLTLI